jgi:hypothetical protein
MAQRSRTGSWHLAMALAAIAVTAAGAQQSDEPPPKLTAPAILPAATINGPHYTVDPPVKAEGYLYEFTLTSDFGPFTANGRSQLATRIEEIRAIAALQDVSKSEVFLKSAGGAIVNIGKGAASAVTNPTETAKGIGAGVKRFGVNLGRASKRAVTSEGGADTGESGAESAASSVLGVSSAMRRWAQKVGADPYTTNITLREALKSIAEVDAAGSIVTKVVVPVPQVIGAVATVGDLVWSKDPEELRKLNEQRAAGLGVSKNSSDAFFRNGWYTLTLQTRFVAALDAVKTPGAADYLETATAADTESEAHFFVESAEMLRLFHTKHGVERLLPDSRAVVAASKGRAALLAPLDYVRATRASMEVLEEIAARSRKELAATRLELVLTGRATERAKKEAKAIGWSVAESQPAR